MLTAIAIDDEPKALEILEIHASKLAFLELKKTFRDALEAIGWLQSNAVDLVFLDINMPDISGLKFKQLMGGKAMIIFTTAYSEYAVESYEQGAVDYLVKPIRFERFMKAALRAQQWQSLKSGGPQMPGPEQELPAVSKAIYVKSGVRMLRLDIDEILYLKKDGNYIYFFTAAGKKVMARLNTDQVMELLPGDRFFQVHKSWIIALPHIREISQQQLTIGKEKIPVAKDRWKELLNRLGL